MSKAKKAKHNVPHKITKPVFKYTSTCCNAPGEKPPVRRDPSDIAENKFSESHLGKWSCTKCHRKCKVTRSKFKEETSNGGTTEATGSTGAENTDIR